VIGPATGTSLSVTRSTTEWLLPPASHMRRTDESTSAKNNARVYHLTQLTRVGFRRVSGWGFEARWTALL